MTIPPPAPYAALVLAGQRQGEIDAVAREAGVSCKAFAQIDGMPMIEHVIGTLRRSGLVGQIYVSLPRGLPVEKEAPALAEAFAKGEILRLDPDVSPARSVGRALDVIEEGAPLLITTGDHALMTTAMVRYLVEGFEEASYDGAAGLVPLEILAAKYPAMRRTKLRFSDGGYKACNLFAFSNRAAAARVVRFWQKMESLRKKPWRMALTLGIPTLIAYALGFMTVLDAFRRIGRLTGTHLQPVLVPVAEAAIDVDSVSDLRFVRELAAQGVRTETSA